MKIMHAMQAKPTTTIGPLSAPMVLPAQGLTFFWVTFTNVRFPIGKLTFLGPTGHHRA